MKTLRYAERAKQIRNKPIIQMDPREELILQLKKELKQTKEEVKAFKEAIGEQQAEIILAPIRQKYGNDEYSSRTGTGKNDLILPPITP